MLRQMQNNSTLQSNSWAENNEFAYMGNGKNEDNEN